MGWNPVKDITNSAKNVFKGVSKTFKSVVDEGKRFIKSDLGKVVMLAAAVWLGGAALGYWNTGFATIDGAMVATQTAAPIVEAGSGTAATNAAASAATGGLSGQTVAAAPMAGGSGMGAVGGGTVATAAPAVDYAAANTALTAGGSTAPAGFMSTAGKAISGAAKWMAANPIPTLVGGQMLSTALTPNQIDIADHERQMRQQEIDASNARLAKVGSVPTMQYSGGVLPVPQQPIPGQPPGIMARKVTL